MKVKWFLINILNFVLPLPNPLQMAREQKSLLRGDLGGASLPYRILHFWESDQKLQIIYSILLKIFQILKIHNQNLHKGRYWLQNRFPELHL